MKPNPDVERLMVLADQAEENGKWEESVARRLFAVRPEWYLRNGTLSVRALGPPDHLIGPDYPPALEIKHDKHLWVWSPARGWLRPPDVVVRGLVLNRALPLVPVPLPPGWVIDALHWANSFAIEKFWDEWPEEEPTP